MHWRRSHPQAAPIQAWTTGRPSLSGDYERDGARHSAFWLRGLELLAALPPKPQRSQPEQALQSTSWVLSRDCRPRFLEKHGATLYGRLTDNLSARRIEEQVVAPVQKAFCPSYYALSAHATPPPPAVQAAPRSDAAQLDQT